MHRFVLFSGSFTAACLSLSLVCSAAFADDDHPMRIQRSDSGQNSQSTASTQGDPSSPEGVQNQSQQQGSPAGSGSNSSGQQFRPVDANDYKQFERPPMIIPYGYPSGGNPYAGPMGNPFAGPGAVPFNGPGGNAFGMPGGTPFFGRSGNPFSGQRSRPLAQPIAPPAAGPDEVNSGVNSSPSSESSSSNDPNMLDLASARAYMLDLINKDRADAKLPPVKVDTIGEKVGQQHAEDMAEQGYFSHWDMQGRKPDQRYSEAGGTGMDMENIHIDMMGSNRSSGGSRVMQPLPKASQQLFPKRLLDEAESNFINERPPNDGHRKNILNPAHSTVGVGLAVAGEPGGGMRVTCDQEFVNHYARIGSLPASIRLGESINIRGQMAAGVRLQSIDLRWEEAPQPMTREDLSHTSGYSMSQDRVLSCFPVGMMTDHPILVDRSSGSDVFDLMLQTKGWKPGLYYIVVWGVLPGNSKSTSVSCHTILVQ